MKKCNKCGGYFEDNMKFCPECGGELCARNVCPQCKTDLGETNYKFCPECGHNLDKKETVTSTSKLERENIDVEITNTINVKPKSKMSEILKLISKILVIVGTAFILVGLFTPYYTISAGFFGSQSLGLFDYLSSDFFNTLINMFKSNSMNSVLNGVTMIVTLGFIIGSTISILIYAIITIVKASLSFKKKESNAPLKLFFRTFAIYLAMVFVVTISNGGIGNYNGTSFGLAAMPITIIVLVTLGFVSMYVLNSIFVYKTKKVMPYVSDGFKLLSFIFTMVAASLVCGLSIAYPFGDEALPLISIISSSSEEGFTPFLALYAIFISMGAVYSLGFTSISNLAVLNREYKVKTLKDNIVSFIFAILAIILTIVLSIVLEYSVSIGTIMTIVFEILAFALFITSYVLGKKYPTIIK